MNGLLTRIIGFVATALWVLAVTLMVLATLPGHALLIGDWGVFTGLVAALLTQWALLRTERARAEEIAAIAAKAALQHVGLRGVEDD